MGTDNLFHKRKERKVELLRRRRAMKAPYDVILIVCEGGKKLKAKQVAKAYNKSISGDSINFRFNVLCTIQNTNYINWIKPDIEGIKLEL